MEHRSHLPYLKRIERMQRKINIAIADDHELYLDGLKLLLSKEKDFNIVGTATNGLELLQIINKFEVDVILTDINMPIMNGIEATKEVIRIKPHIGVIALSMFDDEQNILNILQNGASSYILKGSQKKEIIESIISVYNQEQYYCSKITKRFIKYIIRRGSYNSKIDINDELTKKEIDIVKKICEEQTAKEIAAALNEKTRTIEGIKRRIMQKLNVKSCVGVALYAFKNKIYENESLD